jgi:type IV pilus assembly protein PilQ
MRKTALARMIIFLLVAGGLFVMPRMVLGQDANSAAGNDGNSINAIAPVAANSASQDSTATSTAATGTQSQSTPQESSPDSAKVVVSPAPPQPQGEEVRSGVREQLTKLVCVDFKQTPIEDVLNMLGKQANINIIKSPKVTGTVTATLTDVPLNEALNNILSVHGYTYVTSQNMIRVVPISDITVERKPVNKVYQIKYADVKDVAVALKNFISKNGEVSMNVGTSNIVVTDTEDKIAAIDDFIREVDRVTPQVLVEARIYDFSTADNLDLGVQWQAGRSGADTAFPVSSSSGGTGSTGTGTTATVTGNTTFNNFDPTGVGNVISGGGNRTDPFVNGAYNGTATDFTGTGTASVLRLGILSDSLNIDTLLKAAQKDTTAKLLANPRVLVLDNENADIKIIEEVPYQELSQTSAGGSIGTTQFKEVGVELKVTPHVTSDGLVRLKLHPSFSTQTGTFIVSVQGTGFSNEVPVIDKRETETIALVKTGETVVLGGLKRKTNNQTISKVPLLGDIPVVGLLFRFKGESMQNSELVVFVTPRIVTRNEMTPLETKQLKSTNISLPEVEPKPILDKLKKD